MTTTALKASPCPCGRPQHYARCCGRFHAGELPPDAEALMRARYSAYVLKLEAFLRLTWHPERCPTELALDGVHWLGLEVKDVRQTDATHATVHFVARWRAAGAGGGRAERLEECSRFERVDGAWRYLDGGEAAEDGLSPSDAPSGPPSSGAGGRARGAIRR